MANVAEFAQVDDLLQEYFTALRQYNRALGAYELTAEELRDARRREAANYSRVKRCKDALLERAIAV